MQAHEIMNSQVYKVKETDKVRSVIEKFIAHGISGVPVVNERNEIVGYVSDGDIMRYIGKHKDYVIDWFYYLAVVKGDNEEFEERAKHLLNLNVMTIAKKKIETAQWDDEVETIAATLGNKQIKKVPVVRKGVLVGIISRGNVIRHAFKSLL
ncbi:CBS domain containing membrane protein [Paenibacillus curdlanolyticus YK9]|uniref:CBS domain containing membrane protein n=1 Tax=Paenibacillus curdlanolyticus YK9 TaxID=717606 RepID=E0IG28_9BACL|nr:CBS domain-containing protein [Paenibacillus curdlanolyticus]EFM08608.1 CBS domain containing membrane protein [Paenibacillus curdlanolyticus YK9]